MDGVPRAEDVQRMTILLRPIGARNPAAFNRIAERLHRQQVLQVSENPRRVILANFVTQVNPELVAFGELQAHRRVLGLVGVACSQPSTSAAAEDKESLSRRQSSDEPPSTPRAKQIVERRKSSFGPAPSLEETRQLYDAAKQEHQATLVDSRCVLIGYEQSEVSRLFPDRETLSFPRLDDADGLEQGIREMMRGLFTILESRRVDTSFERAEAPPLPLLPMEEKARVGVDRAEKQGKTYRRKCVGRLRKQCGDWALLTGLPHAALETYTQAIEPLKAAGDTLWLAAALEGWACAATATLYDETAERLEGGAGVGGAMHRVPSMLPQHIRQHQLGVSLGHQRYRSDEDASRLAVGGASGGGGAGVGGAGAGQTGTMERKASRSPWTVLKGGDRSKGPIDAEEIVESLEKAMDHYQKYSYAAWVEYECMMKVVQLHRHRRNYVDMEVFHRDHVGKYLDDSFTRFDHLTKAQICTNSAAVYKQVGFRRKHAFFSRLGVLFRLHVNPGEQRTVSDYRAVQPVLHRTLAGYGISMDSRVAAGMLDSDINTMGPVQVQIKALHEVYTSSNRAQLADAAIRYLCHLLQVYWEELEPSLAQRLLTDLDTCVKQRSSTPVISQALSLDSGIILPPVQLTRFPMISRPQLLPLAAHLAPTVIPANDGLPAIFIYSPFQTKKQSEAAWVVDCPGELSVQVYNCLPSELVVRELCLLGDGVRFEAVPVRLSLPPGGARGGGRGGATGAGVSIKLIGVPRTAGTLTITGYSCEVFGVRSVCRLPGGMRGASKPLMSVSVLPPLPLLSLESSLPRAPIDEQNSEPAAETTVFSGQMFEHSLTVCNTSSTLGIRRVRLQIQQPKVAGGPSLLSVLGTDSLADEKETGGQGQGHTGLTQQDENANPGPSSDASVDLSPTQEGGKKIENKESKAILNSDTPSTSDIIFSLAPREKRLIRFRIFGIDPTATADDHYGAEDRVPESFRPPTPLPPSEEDGVHDLIPYTGRLLSCVFLFTYEAEQRGDEGETLERTARFPLAVQIVPALTVSAWHVLPGDGPFTRYIVVDVTNCSDADAELVYSGTRAISVQPRETCRVPLLCPCCAEVAGRAFHAANQRDSHMMQRIEVERLRGCLERHVARHLDIRWTIPTQSLDGLVPVGALLSSVSLLKQLVLPAISLDVSVNGVPYLSEDDISVGIGEAVSMKVAVISSLDYDFCGILSVECYQEISSQFGTVDRQENVVVVGQRRVPFTVDKSPARSSLPAPRCELSFRFVFRVEGTHKIRPVIHAGEMSEELLADEVFVSPVSFNVVTKAK